MADSIAPVPPTPRKRKPYEHRGGTCPKHGNACAMRRERDTDGPWECVLCAHEAGTLQALEALPPVPPPAAESARTPVAQEPADPAVEGPRAAHAAWQLMTHLERAIGAWNESAIDDAALGVELLRISNDLATESKRLRAAPKGLSAVFGKWPGDESEDQLIDAMRACDLMPQSAHQAPEAPSGGADLSLPAGWQRCLCSVSMRCFVYGATRCASKPPTAQLAGGTWSGSPRGCSSDKIAPTMPQAMCAALGIELLCESAERDLWSARLGSCTLTPHGLAFDADTAARKALERFHARQQAGAPPDVSAPAGEPDIMHPTGRCSCAGEGKCAWCRAHCFDCGVTLPCREHPGNNLPEHARTAEAERQRDVWKELHETATTEWLRTQAAARNAGATIEALREIFNDYEAEEISSSKAVERFRDLCTAVAERLRAERPSAPEPKRENVSCVHCYGRGAYNLPDGSEYTCGSCNGSGTDEPFVPRSAEPKRERITHDEALELHQQQAPQMNAVKRERMSRYIVQQADRDVACAELERRARELCESLGRGVNEYADALAELLGGGS